MATSRRPAAAPRPTPAAARKSQASRVRTAVRTQLALSQRKRQELSHALRALRRDLREFRSQVRMRLREMSHEVATRRIPVSKTFVPVAVGPPRAAAIAAPIAAPPEPVKAAAAPPEPR